MDEQKDNDVSVSRSDLGDLPKTVTVSKHGDGKSDTPVESLACEAQSGKIVGSSKAGGGEDEMVKVEGGCSNSNGARVGSDEDLNVKEIGGVGHGESGEATVEIDLRSVVSEGDAADDCGARKNGVSSHQLEAGLVRSSEEERASGEGLERNNKVIGSEDAGGTVDDIYAHKNGVQIEKVEDREVRTKVEVSTVDVGSTGGETQVVDSEGIMNVSEEDGLERALPSDDVGRGCELVSAAVCEALGAENVVGSSTSVSDTLSEETQFVGKGIDIEIKEFARGAEQAKELDVAREKAKELVEGPRKGRDMDVAGEDAQEDMGTQNLGTSNDKTQKPGNQILVSGSPVTVKYSREAAIMVNDEGLNPKDDAAGNGSTKRIVSSSEEKKNLRTVLNDPGTGKDINISAHSKSLDVQNPDSLSSRVAEMDKEEFTCSTMEGMETDSFDENLSFSLEELQGNFGRLDGSTENHFNIYADTMEIDEQVTTADMDEMLSCSGTVRNFKDENLSLDTRWGSQATGRGVEIHSVNRQEGPTSTMKVLMPTQNDHHLKLEERFGKGGDCHVAHPQAASIVGEDMVVDREVNDAERVNSDVGQTVENKIRPFAGDIGDEVTTVDIKGSSFPVIEVPSSSVEARNEDEGQRIAQGDNSAAGTCHGVDCTIEHETQPEEQVVDAEQADLHGVLEMEAEEQDSDTEQPETSVEKFVNRVTTRAGSLMRSHKNSCLLPLEVEGEFCVSALVWGKVRSHPWWPGQIYDLSDASEKAMKYHKKDCFLVAYFWDQTFAWVDASQLKPFYSHFSQAEKQSNAEVFQNAVSCALEEVSRRVQLGLACPCILKSAYDEIRLQIVDNAGIRQETIVTERVDKSASVQSFQPDKLVEYVKALAHCPSGGADRVELVIAKAQLLSFYRLKGYYQLPELQFCGDLVEDGFGTSQANPLSNDDEHIYRGQGVSESQRISYNKHKHNLKDSIYPRTKEKSLSDLMTGPFDSIHDAEFDSDGNVSPSPGKKHKVVDFAEDDSLQDGRKTISLAKVSTSAPTIPKPSFKIGDCIRRVASQMTGSPLVLKGNSERLQKFDGDASDVFFKKFEDAEGKRTSLPTDYLSLDDLLAQLHLAATDPMKGYSFLNVIVSFFSDFKNSIISGRHVIDKICNKRKRSSQIMGFPETFEFEDMSDTYWTDRVIQNGAEEQSSPPAPAAATERNNRGYQIVPVELKPVQKTRRSYSRKQYTHTNNDLTPSKPPGYVDENSPAELRINFIEVDSIPSETNLNKIFRRFGPLKEYETEVDRGSSRARVVFKKCSDAEVAHNSATKFNIFGSMAVNYQLSYTVSEPFYALPIVTSLGE